MQYNQQELLTVGDVADRLRLTREAVYDMVGRGQLPAVRLSPRRMRFRPEDIEAVIASRQTGVKAA